MMGSDSNGHGSLRVYAALARLDRLGYEGKIMLVAFVGIHVPLLALVGWSLTSSVPYERLPETLVVTLVATLVGTALTLLTLHQLLRPITTTAEALRAYVADRTLPMLPTEHRDAVGRLMADTEHALRQLEEARDALEHRDPTTGLPNRTGLLRALAERGAAPDAGPFALCALGIDGLDEIASAFGRVEAERTLRLAAASLDVAAPADGTLCRLDAATLALVIDTADPDEVAGRMDRLDGRLERLDVDGVEHTLECRRGVALWPLDDRDLEGLLDDALVALEVARRRDVPWAFYSEGSRDALIERYRLGRDLRLAIEREELTLHYQPVIDAARDRVVGAEALVRWQHPELGLLLPRRFVPLAEESALIERLGLWTLETVCRQIGFWRDTGIVVPPIAINLSARQFADPELPARIASLVAAHELRPGDIEVELTETSATADVIETGRTMETLRALGVGMAIDDFGTGHSSLSHLRTMPFDKLKIDREFVCDVDTNEDHLAICRTLIVLARELGLEVLAEGVESAAEVVVLRAQGCELFQGYHFHRPLPAAAFAGLLRERRAATGRDGLDEPGGTVDEPESARCLERRATGIP